MFACGQDLSIDTTMFVKAVTSSVRKSSETPSLLLVKFIPMYKDQSLEQVPLLSLDHLKYPDYTSSVLTTGLNPEFHLKSGTNERIYLK